MVKVLPKLEQNIPIPSKLDTLMAVEHGNVIQLFQVIENIENIHTIMEHAGEVQRWHLILDADGMQEEAKRPFRQIAGKTEKGTEHLDLKAESILVDVRGNSKLLNFSLSIRFKTGQKRNKFWGPLQYLAPEVTERKKI